MAAVRVPDVLLRISPKMLEKYQSLAVAGAGRGRAKPVPYTFTRAAPSASYIDRDGTLRLAGVDKVRIEWVDLDGDGVRETPGLLLEGSRTNGWDRSEELDHANWTKTGATVSANTATAPDGVVSSDSLTESAANELHFFSRATPTLTDNTRTTVTVFARPSSRAWFRIVTTDKSNTSRSTWFNASTGLAGVTNAGHKAFTFPQTGAHYRFGVSFDSATGATAPSVDIAMALVDGGGAYLGDGSSGMNFWGMMIEVDKAFPSSYLKTVAAAVTRAADSLTVPFNFGPMDLTVLARIARPSHADITGSMGFSPRIYEIGNTAPFLRAFFNDTSRQFFSQIDTTVTDGSVGDLAIPSGAELTYLTQWRNLVAGGQAAHDAGSGLSAFGSTASGFAKFGEQTLHVGSLAGAELSGVLLDLIIARGLFTRVEMLAIP